MRQVALHTLWIPCAIALSACGSLSAMGVPVCDVDDPDCNISTGTDEVSGDLNGETECSDGLDNDQNGMADCEDPACLGLCDADGDGFIAAGRGGDDCDDTKKKTYPGADEVCDSRDNDCDSEIDEDSDLDGSDACEDCDNGDGGIYPGATEVCGDGIDSNCDDEDCLEDWTEDFETGSHSADWVFSGAQPWDTVAVVVQEGAFGGASGTITHSQVSAQTVTVDFNTAGTLSFWHSGSTESGFDFLILSIDGAQQGSWSGSWGWTQENINVSAGQHTIGWTYTKDSSVNFGNDRVWVDYIELVNGSPI